MGQQGTEDQKGDVLRLSRALESGTGHVAVIADDRATARARARGALVRVEAAAVLHVSAVGVEAGAATATPGASSDPKGPRSRVRNLMAPLLEQARAVEKPAFIIVDDADLADGPALEHIRIAVECAPDAIKWLRIVLVGGEGLERALSDPAASALASRLCARVRFGPEPVFDAARPSPAPLGVAAVTAFGVAFAALGAWSYLSRSSTVPDLRAARGAGPEVVLAQAQPAGDGTPTPAAVPAQLPSDAVQTGASLAAPVRTKPVGAEPAAGAAIEPVEREPVPANVQGAVAAAADAPNDEAPRDGADTSKASALPIDPVPPKEAVKPAIADPRPQPQPVVSASHAAPKAKAPVRVVARAPAGASTVKADVPPISREVVLQVGSFEDARQAYALRDELGSRLDHVLVARVDADESSPLYTVRVVGLESPREVAEAEGAIHDLGQEAVRYSKPGPLQRLGRSWRPFLASLFGH